MHFARTKSGPGWNRTTDFPRVERTLWPLSYKPNATTIHGHLFPDIQLKTELFRREELPADEGREFICATGTQMQYRRVDYSVYCTIDNVLVASTFVLLYFGTTCRAVQYFHTL
jgi:hypothetical protein